MHVPIIPLGALTKSSLISDNSAGRELWRNPFSGAGVSPHPSLTEAIELWLARSQHRQQLRELAGSDDHLLDDMGISKDAALHEAEKWFWQR